VAAGNEPVHLHVIQDFCGAGRYALETTEVCVRHSSPSFAVRRRVRIGLVFCGLAAWGCASSLSGVPRGLGRVEGEVRIAGGQSVTELGPAVVYLERTGERGVRGAGTLDLFDDRGPGLGHDLVVRVRGQSLRFVSRSGVAHRLFAIRGDERIEVAVPEHGESRSVPMEQVGWIRFYCSLHQDENWDVFVSPSPHFARLDRQGRYRIEQVPRGDYQLSIWSAAVDGPARPVHVGFGTATQESISLDRAKIRP